jgi:hypothetical protein
MRGKTVGAATASSAVLGGLFLLLIAVGAALAYSIAGSGNHTLTSGLNDFAWACVVLTSFPRAMLIMAETFGLWRAGLISNALFATGASRRAGLAGRHHVAERSILGTVRRLFAVRPAHYRPGVGRGREPGPLDPEVLLRVLDGDADANPRLRGRVASGVPAGLTPTSEMRPWGRGPPPTGRPYLRLLL